jgi:hypothetical protein
MDLDKAFSNGQWKKNCRTVGDVLDELGRLPRDLPVHSGFTDSVDLVVFNRKQPDQHLEFADGGDWDESAVTADEDEDDDEC